MGLFNEIYPDDNRRPDILLRNPFGGGRQVILDVAVTGVDGTDRKVGDHPHHCIVLPTFLVSCYKIVTLSKKSLSPSS